MDPKKYIVDGKIDINLLKKQPKAVRESVQAELKKAGLYTGEVDGIIGKLSTSAINTANTYNSQRTASPTQTLATKQPQTVIRQQDTSDSPKEGYVPVKSNGFTTYVKQNSRSYIDLYNSGRLMNYDPATDEFIAPELKAVDITAKRPTESYNERVRKQNEYIRNSGIEKGNYAIVDKEAGTISYYNPDNTLIQSEPVITGKSRRDRDYGYSSREWLAKPENKDKTFKDYINYLEASDNKVTPSGRFTVGSVKNDILDNPQAWWRRGLNELAYYWDGVDRNKDIAASRKKSYGSQGKLLTMISDVNAASSKAIHGTDYPEREQALANALTGEASPEDLRMSAGCINIGDKSICFDKLGKGSGIYILPEQSDKIVEKSAKKMLPQTTNTILESKRRIYDSLKKQGINPTDEEIDFLTATHGKESTYGNSFRAYLENFAPDRIARSKGEMSIGKPFFRAHLPKNVSQDYKFNWENAKSQIGRGGIIKEALKTVPPDFDKEIAAVHDFYQDHSNETDFEKYARFNSGNRIPQNATARKNLRGFKQIYDRVTNAYNMGGQIKPMNYALGGWMDIAMAGSQVLGNIGAGVNDVVNPVADPTQGDYKFNWGDALNPTKGGILLELAKKMSMDKERSKYVMGASPGNYAKGGMISKQKAREILHDGTVHGEPITEKQRRFFGYMATRKANGGMIMDMINPSQALNMLTQPQTVRSLLTGNTSMPMKDNSFAMGGKTNSSMMEYATGGDMKISDSSFVVDGNPSITDGNYYPQMNVKLDHGEVVKNNFVYSNKLKDPNTNITFANLAKPIEKSTGKSENYLRKFPNDPIATRTVNINNMYLGKLKDNQEALASLMGLRGEQPQGMAYGGMVKGYAPGGYMGNPKDPTQTYMSVEGNIFYDPYKNNFLMRGADGSYAATGYRSADKWLADNAANVQSFKKQYPLVQPTPKPSPNYVSVKDGIYYDTNNNEFSMRTAAGTYIPTAYRFAEEWKKNNPWALGQGAQAPMTPGLENTQRDLLGTGSRMAVASVPRGGMQTTSVPTTGTKSTGSTKTKAADSKSYDMIDRQAMEGFGPYQNDFSIWRRGGESPILSPEEQNAAQEAFLQAEDQLGLIGPEPYNPNYDGRAKMLSDMYAKEDPTFMSNRQDDGMDPNLSMASKAVNPESGKGRGFGSNFTTGDYLNAAAVLGRFGQLIGGPEVEKPIYDTTQISRANYDPASQLYQANRQTSAMLNRADVPSINARTALANNMLGQRLNQESQIRSQYDTMNRQALLDYENRVATQRRYNIAQDLATNQMNAQNRAAYKEAWDNAMTSLGGFGTALNQKQQGTDVLNILKTMYPDVYRRIMNGEKVNLAEEAPEAVKTETTPATKYLGGILKGYYSGGKIRKGGRYGR